MNKTALSKSLIFTSLFMLLTQTTNVFAGQFDYDFNMKLVSFGNKAEAVKKSGDINKNSEWNWDNLVIDEKCKIKLDTTITVTARTELPGKNVGGPIIDIVSFSGNTEESDVNKNVNCWIIYEKSAFDKLRP
jgi:hypothetical protein